MLSGFVIGYAYDCCWREGRMTVREFLRRRLSRSGAKKGLKIIRPWVSDQLSKVLSILDTSVCNCFSSGRRSSMLLQA